MSYDDFSQRSDFNQRTSGLPDPEFHAEFYQDVTAKRFFAWVIDTIVIGILTALVIVFTAFLAAFIAPLVFMVIGFVYRTVTIAKNSATPGMWLMAIELRTHRGERLDTSMALLHTLAFTVSFSVVILQILSVGLMALSPQGKGLGDHLLGTAMINRISRY
ncbi:MULTISPECIES: RDD family protein [Halocynthiibacter]|uniref:RDD family protein n=1 Tax=Halocynthiibacter halioticoli TaxID=2986804 RepID=A0AAE3LR42_9RHOB|nr:MULTISPECIES: RDD family protein [Halocynthiibacter]MCV6824203.1 RDD family protein [Halocynthiibacter halioticoli]MCW4057204.1 RDD family protein [Halocynthiibacter sp. SDUM655004]MDE0589767.1 RDD family protein [Halocynthiibacter sp. C4]